MRMGSVVMGKASQAVIAKGSRIAAAVLETDAADVSFAEGRFTVKGTDRSIGLFEVARAAREHNDLPEDLRGLLAADLKSSSAWRRFRSAARSARSRSTRVPGGVDRPLHRRRRRRPRNQSADPARPDARRHRHQGVGQALWEHLAYDPRERASSWPATMMDYAMPRARSAPPRSP